MDMERYRSRPGVVLTSVCGEYLLLAAKAAREHCPYMTQLSESSAFLWKLLIDGAGEDELLRAVCAEYEIDEPETARQGIETFIGQMLESGYLLREGEKHE